MKNLPSHLKSLFVGCLLLVVGCTSKEDIQGQFIGSFQSNIDSIQLFPNGIYKRAIYDNNKNKIFSNSAKYEIKNDYIMFHDFLLNENDLSTSLHYDSDDLLLASLPYIWTLSGTTIVSNDDLGYFYFRQ